MAVAGKDNVAHVHKVRLGERMGSSWVVEEGLAPGDMVIVEGLQKVREGVPVQARPLYEAGGSEVVPCQSSSSIARLWRSS